MYLFSWNLNTLLFGISGPAAFKYWLWSLVWKGGKEREGGELKGGAT